MVTTVLGQRRGGVITLVQTVQGELEPGLETANEPCPCIEGKRPHHNAYNVPIPETETSQTGFTIHSRTVTIVYILVR